MARPLTRWKQEHFTSGTTDNSFGPHSYLGHITVSHQNHRAIVITIWDMKPKLMTKGPTMGPWPLHLRLHQRSKGSSHEESSGIAQFTRVSSAVHYRGFGLCCVLQCSGVKHSVEIVVDSLARYLVCGRAGRGRGGEDPLFPPAQESGNDRARGDRRGHSHVPCRHGKCQAEFRGP